MSNAYNQLFSQLQCGIPMPLDLNQSVHQSFYNEHLARQGISSSSHPQLFNDIAPANYSNNPGPTPIDIISRLDTTDGQNYTATVLSSIPPEISSCILTIELQDENRNTLAQTSQTINGGGKDVQLSVDGAFSTPASSEGRKIVALATSHYSSDNGTHVTVTQLTTFSHPTSIKLTAPKDLTGDKVIKIGISGNESGTGCDYTSTKASSQIAMPLQGKIEYASNIITNQGKPVKATCNLKLFNETNGANALCPMPDFDFFNHPNTVISGNSISWDLGWVDFNQVFFTQVTGVYLVMIVSLQVEGKQTEQVTAIISNTAPDPKEYWNTLQIYPIKMLASNFPPDSATFHNKGYMNAASINAYNFDKGAFTVEGWINATSSGTIISRKSTNGGATIHSGFLLVLQSDGTFKLATDNGFGFYEINTAASNVINTGPHHVAGVRAPDGELFIYLDGELLSSSPNSSLPTPLAINTNIPLDIGATNQQQEPFNHYNGQMCLVRVWNKQRSLDELRNNASIILSPDSQGLMAQWPLLGNGSDDSSAGNDMTILGDARFG